MDTKEKAELEAMIGGLKDWLAKTEPDIELKKKELAKLDRQIEELEDPNLDPEAAARRLKFAAMANAQDRADAMREEFRNQVLPQTSAQASSLSSTPRGVGAEAVETTDMHANGPIDENGDEGEDVPVRVYSPAGKNFNEEPVPPAIVFFHGGGYVLGDLETHDWLCRSLAALAGATIVSVDYRRAPEHKYPAAFEDAYAALLWVGAGGLGTVPKRIGVAGDDAGASLAAACCLRAKDDPQAPAICVQLLAYPWLDLRPDAPSMKHEFANGRHGLSSDECHFFREAYAPEGSDPDGGGPWTQDITASPCLAESLAGLPRAFIVYPVHSMLSGESIDYVERLRREAGPEAVHTIRVEGPKHHFAVMPADQQTQHVVSAVATFASALLWAP